MKTMKLSSKNQVVIPKVIRTRLKLTSGDTLVIEKVTADSVVLRKAPSFHDLIGTLQPQKQDPVIRVRQLRDDWR
jgi:AbrB family looped-hinge helix DNA binding protein